MFEQFTKKAWHVSSPSGWSAAVEHNSGGGWSDGGRGGGGSSKKGGGGGGADAGRRMLAASPTDAVVHSVESKSHSLQPQSQSHSKAAILERTINNPALALTMAAAVLASAANESSFDNVFVSLFLSISYSKRTITTFFSFLMDWSCPVSFCLCRRVVCKVILKIEQIMEI